MKNKINKTVVILALVLAVSAQAQKKVKTFTVSRVIPANIENVWQVVGEDFGAISNSHPQIVSSSYNQGSITYGGEGAERICNLNEDGTKYVKEKQLSFDRENHTFTVQLFHSEGIPLNPEYTKAVYTVKEIDQNNSEVFFDMTYRTTPAFMGWLAKGKFKKGIKDYLIAVEHHVITGENVNKDNFKQIKKNYKKSK
ncbi:SRPBCC family protein [Flavicella marina]|uniref:SRPBCC family protein n=1 Tax=Flavicella marina TaxID=1475951 RepID=UPI001264C255|nr:SRPBCC family protein [Flavicella marina]